MLERLLLTLFLVPLVFGCRAPDPSVELLEGELRWMEDQLYMLEDQLEQKCEELAAYRSRPKYDTLPRPRRGSGIAEPIPAPIEPTPARGRRGVPGGGTPAAPPEGAGPAVPPATPPEADGLEPDVTDPLRDLDEMTEDELENLQPPEIMIPDTGGYELQTPPSEGDPLRGAPPQLDESLPGPDALQTQGYFERAGQAARRRGIDADVSHIVVTARVPEDTEVTMPEGAWVIAPDDAPLETTRTPCLQLLVQPRNKDGVYVALPSEVTVVVLDSSATGADARVGRWEFDASHCRRMMRSSELGNGIHLEIPWDEIVRRPEHLHVFVRYTAVDGRQLEDDMALSGAERVDLAAGQWTPSARAPRTSRGMNGPRPWSPYR